jgi:hypothetical protein
MSTPNMRFSADHSVDQLRGSTDWIKQLIALLGLLSLPFLRLQDFVQSGLQTTSRTKKWFFNIVSILVLLGIPFLIISSLARHNVSEYADQYQRHIRDGDIQLWDALLTRHAGVDPLECRFLDHALGSAETSHALMTQLNPVKPKSEHATWLHWLRYQCQLAVPDGTISWDEQLERIKLLRGKLQQTISRNITSGRLALAVLQEPTLLARLKVKLDRIEKDKQTTPMHQLRQKNVQTLKPLLVEWEARLQQHAMRKQEDQRLTAEECREQDIRNLSRMGHLMFFTWYHDLPGTFAFGFVSRPVVISQDQLHRAVILVISAVVFLVCLFHVDLNYTSALAFYRRQLSRIWLQTGEIDSPTNTTGESLENYPLALLRNCEVRMPYHLLNTAVDLYDPRRESTAGFNRS